MGHLGVPLPRLVLPLVLLLEMVGAALLVVDRYVWLVSLAWIASHDSGDVALSRQVHDEGRHHCLSAVRHRAGRTCRSPAGCWRLSCSIRAGPPGYFRPGDARLGAPTATRTLRSRRSAAPRRSPVFAHGNSAAMRTASSMLSASTTLKPAIISFVSANGPSVVVVAAGANAHGFRRRRCSQHLGVEKLALVAQLVRVRDAVPHARVELGLRQRLEQRGVVVDQQHEFHGERPRCASSRGGWRAYRRPRTLEPVAGLLVPDRPELSSADGQSNDARD